MGNRERSGALGGSLCALLFACAPPAPAAAQPGAGEHDVRTVFFVDKSDDRNRVDYGLRLDESCQPIGDSPLYAYWRRFEPRQRRFGRLNGMDRRVYGIRSQRVTERTDHGTWVELRLAGLPHQRILVLVLHRGGRCIARAQTMLQGHELMVDHVHVQLGGIMGIDHVVVAGEDVRSGHHLHLRIDPPHSIGG